MIVVSDASPIINLAIIGRLDFLRSLYGNVIIPQAVQDEVSAALPGKIKSEFEKLKWIETKQTTNRTSVLALELELDQGEAEAITLALEINADLLLIDERKGRLVANRFGLRFIGLLGVLIEAKQKGLVSTVKSQMDDLISKAGFWISPKLYNQVLEQVGE